MINTIHFIDGEKGGVGKSLFARVMMQRCIDRNYPHTLVESDPSNPDVGEIYCNAVEEQEDGIKKPIYKQVLFSESERKTYEADEIFELSLVSPIIVNLPATAANLTTSWIDRNGLLNLKDKVKICKWFVSNGGYDSIQLFIKTLNHFQGGLQHVFVRNFGLCPTWAHIDNRKELQRLIKEYRVSVIDFPLFPYPERDYIDEKRCTFDAARADDELGGILAQQRLATFLRQSYEQIDTVEGIVWQPEEFNRAGEISVESYSQSNDESHSQSNGEGNNLRKGRGKKTKQQPVATSTESSEVDVIELEHQGQEHQAFVEAVT